MAKIIPAAGISAISGSVGNMIFKTRRKADGSTDVRLYQNPYRDWRGRKIDVRTTPVSEKELASRQLFAQASRMAGERAKQGDQRPRGEIIKEVYAELKAKQGSSAVKKITKKTSSPR